jgi:hypothetical protein
MRRDIKNVFSAATLLASLVALGCEGPTEYFRTAQIDPLTMKMNLGGRLTSPPPPGMVFTSGQELSRVIRFNTSNLIKESIRTSL